MKYYEVAITGEYEFKHKFYNYSEALDDYKELKKKMDWGRITLCEIEATELESCYIPQEE